MPTETIRDLVHSLREGRLSRGEFLIKGAALGMSATAMSALLIEASSGPAPAEAAAMKGQLVISTIQNPPQSAKNALGAAYKAKQPGVTIIWETKHTDPAQYER